MRNYLKRKTNCRDTRKRFLASFILITCMFNFLFIISANSDVCQEMRSIKSSQSLARFIYVKATKEVTPEELYDGICSKDTLKIQDYEITIPVREVYGTIISERYGDQKIGKDFMIPNKVYGVREICSFRDFEGNLWRFHIIIFNDQQYEMMENMLRDEIRKNKTNRNR